MAFIKVVAYFIFDVKFFKNLGLLEFFIIQDFLNCFLQ
jgi:hypothetical protein